MSELIDRVVNVTLSQTLRERFFSTINQVQIRHLGVRFAVEKSLDDQPNKCEVQIINLSEQSRAECQRERLHLRLDAGYVDNLALVFQGDVTFAHSVKEPTEWVTTLTLGDGARAYNYARVNRSFKAGADPKTLVRELAGSMGLEFPMSLEGAKEFQGALAKGVTLSGPSHKEMTRVLKARGFDWSVQDGRLQIQKDSETEPDEVQVIAQDNGMIGSPDFGPSKEEGSPPHLTVKVLLRPAIQPGRRVIVQSRAVRGTFKVIKVKHEGDTHSADSWTTTVEAVPL